MLDYPDMHIEQAKAIVQLANEACAAAAMYQQLDLDSAPSKSDIPCLPE